MRETHQRRSRLWRDRRWVSLRSTHPTTFVSFVSSSLRFFFPAHPCGRFFLSFFPLRTFVTAAPGEGGGGAPRGVQPCTSRASNARRHVCETWALPRSREARLAALRRGVVGPGPASVPVAGSGAKAPRCTGIAAGPRSPGFSFRGYKPRATPHPAPPSRSLLERAPR